VARGADPVLDRQRRAGHPDRVRGAARRAPRRARDPQAARPRWILVRRAAGIDQREGVLGRVFAITAVVGCTAFTIWFLLINGPGSSSFSGQGG